MLTWAAEAAAERYCSRRKPPGAKRAIDAMGFLHDAAEDQGGEPRLADIRNRFGDRVADIVHACSDSMVNTAGGQ